MLQKHLFEQGLIFNQAKIHLKSDCKKAILEAIKDIKNCLKEIMNYIEIHPEFQHTLKPINVLPGAPKIIQYMAESARKANVGPMASVAGAIADFGLKAMGRTNAMTSIVEDGGEIAITTDKPVVVGLFSNCLNLSSKQN
ncbi:MAG: hypothetical protein QXH91_04545 [Candidatus Bathyarchaeia archaeon]